MSNITDILIIGSGGAGLTAGIKAKELGAKVIIASQNFPTRSQTSMAQGGINAVINIDKDSIEQHINDTLKAGYFINDKEMVSKMCHLSPKVIEWLDSIGVPFSRTKDGHIAQRRLGGVKANRACYSQDYTGLKILQTLFDKSLKENIEFKNEYYLLKIIVEDNLAKGAIFLDIRSGEIKQILAKAVILATGGYAGLYHEHTTNIYSSSGDGITLSFKEGAKLDNLEFVQFHPTGLKKSSILISESARGAGGKLLNQNGERFVDELLPRDKVSLAIVEEMEKGNEVFLDIRHLGEEFIDENLPQERKLAKLYEGVDPVKDIIPIKPVAHYSMGGVKVDENLQSSIKGLFAVGECSEAGVHGANRLGGNSLLEIIAFGKMVAYNTVEYIKEIKNINAKDTHIKSIEKEIEDIFENTHKINFYKKRDELGEMLYRYAGIKRDENGLKKLLEYIEDLQENIPNIGIVDRSKTYNTNLVEFLRFKNSITLAKEVTKSAIKRKESIGSHFRSDA